MHQGFPITIKFDSQLNINKNIALVASKTEMWINFAALKNGWYADESCVLEFEFIVLEQPSLTNLINNNSNNDWQLDEANQYAFIHRRDKTQVEAYIVIDILQADIFELKLKSLLTEIANNVVKQYGFVAISPQ